MSARFPGSITVSQRVAGLSAEVGGRLDNDVLGTTLTNSTTKTALCSSQIPAGALVAGRSFEFAYMTHVLGVTGTPTLTYELSATDGTTTRTLFTGAATTVAADNYSSGRIIIAATEAAGAAAQICAYGHHNEPAATGIKPVNYQGTLDTTKAITVTLKVTWSAASTSNQVRALHSRLTLH